VTDSNRVLKSVEDPSDDDSDWDDPIVIVGRSIRLPGGIDSIEQFAEVLYSGRSAIGPVPQSRFDRSLYYDDRRGQVGKSYTQLGGCVSSEPLDKQVEARIAELGCYDLTHRQFAQVAVRAWNDAGISSTASNDARSQWGRDELAAKCGIFVGHSGGTDQGGPLAMATLADAALHCAEDVPGFAELPADVRDRIRQRVAERMRAGRPIRQDDSIHFDAYRAASLVGRLLGLGGIREVIDAACASSLLALEHAISAIRMRRLDAAIVGGATYNNIDNLILFSQSQACSEGESAPFDERASGLISSEGYVAIVVTRQSIARRLGLPIRGIVRGVGVSSDGRGKSLWAPRSEGQQLAIRRGYPHAEPLSIDYLEAHATSTQVGDATELESLVSVRRAKSPLLVGSVKSNLGHTLEAAGLVGLVKLLLALDRGEIPPTIHFENPTSEFDWSLDQVRVVDRVTRWPSARQQDGIPPAPRRCAVNAFGIGGLNGHAVVESAPADVGSRCDLPPSRPRVRRRRSDQASDPIAIVGRGVVLPGAFNMESLGRLMRDQRSSIGHPPAGRWIGGGVEQTLSPFAVPTDLGGYIKDYRFDGQPYRIPPKQVELANPLQMMLIDAVQQAATEADGGKWLGNRERTSVVIGTIFGGEFSNQLQIGLRLPEICRRMIQELRESGIEPARAATISEQYRREVLKRYSALLDETGGFTASTLASRISKSFDLMGGACAIDADDASGALALLLATDQLQSAAADTVVCGVARRSLDLVGFKDLQVRGRLAAGAIDGDIPLDCSRVWPGEGVAVVMLRRLSDAVRDGQTILGIIDSVQSGMCQDASTFWRQTMAADSINQRIVKRIGYLAGAHPVIRLLAETINWSHGEVSQKLITAVAEDGFYITVQTRHPAIQLRSQADATENPLRKGSERNGAAGIASPQGSNELHDGRGMNDSRLATSVRLMDKESTRTIIIQGADENEFIARLDQGSRSPESLFTSEELVHARSRYRAGVIASNPQSLAGAVEAIGKAWSRGQRACVLDRNLSLLWDAGVGPGRVAWAFPGQGAQYSAVPQVVSQDPAAAKYVSRFDEALAKLGIEGIAGNLADSQQQLGRDVWWTQLWVLAVSATLADSLTRAGHRADLVYGHSFGECGAALHAGVMNMEQAIRFARLRSEAVVMTSGQRGQLLSVRATPSRVDAVLATLGTTLQITHHNAPHQTVIAGTAEQIEIAKQAFAEQSIASLVIAVPAAFHSSAMTAARSMLKNTFGGEHLRPPRISIFSTIRGRYLAEPGPIRNALIDQLTRPLLYCGGVERLVADGYRLLVDVGPSDMLTRLHRTIVGESALCVSLDSSQHSHADRLRLIALAERCVVGEAGHQPSGPKIVGLEVGVAKPQFSHRDDWQVESDRTVAPTIEVIDVTRRGRVQAGRDGTARGNDSDTATSATIDADESRWDASRVSTQRGRVVAEAVAEATAADRTTTDSATQAASPMASREAVDSFLVDLVVELTGYSREVIDFDADLEAELGVDSIKKAQVIGELAAWASLELDLKQIRLASFQSLADIGRLVETVPQSHSGATAGQLLAGVTTQSESSGYATAPLPGVAKHSLPDIDIRSNGPLSSQAHESTARRSLGEPTQGTFASSQRVGGIDLAADPVAALMIDFIVDQTGYSPDIIDMEADLEGELGVDSIKKAQLLGELASHFELHDVDLRRLRLADFPTLGSIREFVLRHDASGATLPLLDTTANGSTHKDHGSAKKKMTHQAVDAPPEAVDEFNDVGMWTQWQSTPIPSRGTCRFGLTMVDAPRRAGMPRVPRLVGDALILGQNRIADSLARRLRAMGLEVHRFSASVTIDRLDAALALIWQTAETPNLFLTTPHDDTALGELSSIAWQQRRQQALEIPFRICQLWMQRMIDREMMDRAVLVSALNAGGDFGFSASRVVSSESGGLAGLTKAMLIESWMRGYRETPMKVIDIAPETSSEAAVDGILAELAVPSHDEEVCVDSQSRRSVRPVYQPLSDTTSRSAAAPTVGGTWVITGGGRGITALTAMALAEKYRLKLHLLGTAPHPELTDEIRDRAATARASLRREVMAGAQASGDNPIETWRDLEKAIEIDLTLRECTAQGIKATYHCVDVSSGDQVAAVLRDIRRADGPIRGVIHGAGAGQDARFDRKRLEKVDKCIRAKVDGAISLADATVDDPLEWFVGFGSISGRFGANGHTDYSLANDMLAKVIDRLRQQRPDVRCLTFHWHAWGDIGMATKPEAKLALEMIGMEFMPATEGLEHFLAEFERGGDLAEVLITDRNYIRKFFPAMGDAHPATVTLPMLAPAGLERGQVPQAEDLSWAITLDPVGDRFLYEHRVGDLPTLPFVVALEMLAEAAKNANGGATVSVIRAAQAMHALKFSSDDAMAVEIVPTNHTQRSAGNVSGWSLCADLRRRDGRVVEPSRVHFKAEIQTGRAVAMPGRLELKIQWEGTAVAQADSVKCPLTTITYPDRDAPIYHGESLRTLRRIATSESGEAIGLITAPSPVQLGGERRPVEGWCIPCAVMDGVLYASAVLAFQMSGRASLPVRFGEIHLGRLPDPGEPLTVRIRSDRQDESGMILHADLLGLNGDRLIAIRDYRIHWIS